MQRLTVAAIAHTAVDPAPSAPDYLRKTSRPRAIISSFDPADSFRYFTYISALGPELKSRKLRFLVEVAILPYLRLLKVDKEMEVLFT